MNSKIEDYLFLFSHGAGAGIESVFMKEMVSDLNKLGLQTVPFNFPYMKIMEETGKRRPPDRMPKLIDSFKQKIKDHIQKYPNKKIVIGGKSMGGRVASLVVSEVEDSTDIKACICLGFPFHPPKKLDKYRGEHLESIKTPIFIFQGERDPFGTMDEVNKYLLSTSVRVRYVPDGDHSFKPRIKSGHTLERNIDQCIEDIIEIVSHLD